MIHKPRLNYTLSVNPELKPIIHSFSDALENWPSDRRTGQPTVC